MLNKFFLYSDKVAKKYRNYIKNSNDIVSGFLLTFFIDMTIASILMFFLDDFYNEKIFLVLFLVIPAMICFNVISLYSTIRLLYVSVARLVCFVTDEYDNLYLIKKYPKISSGTISVDRASQSPEALISADKEAEKMKNPKYIQELFENKAPGTEIQKITKVYSIQEKPINKTLDIYYDYIDKDGNIASNKINIYRCYENFDELKDIFSSLKED